VAASRTERLACGKHFSGKAEEEIGKAEEEIGKAEEEIGKAEEEIGKAEEKIGKAEEEIGKGKERISRGNLSPGLFFERNSDVFRLPLKFSGKQSGKFTAS